MRRNQRLFNYVAIIIVVVSGFAVLAFSILYREAIIDWVLDKLMWAVELNLATLSAVGAVVFITLFYLMLKSKFSV